MAALALVSGERGPVAAPGPDGGEAPVAVATALRSVPAAQEPDAPAERPAVRGAEPEPVARGEALEAALAAVPPDEPGLQAVTPVALFAGSRVVLRVPAAAGAPDGLADLLESAGVAGVALTPLALPLGESRIGYYHREDRAAAEALARLLARPEDPAALPVRDYGTLLPRPARGTIDLWIAG